jgi:thiol-disulfide isomerase/thioredoxin
MTRYWAIALLVVLMPVVGSALRAGGKDVKIQDKLTKDSTKDTKRGFACKVHVVPMKAGKVYTIDMVTKDFDAYLRLEDPSGKQLDEDDDSGGDLNARIIFNCMKDGNYRVIATCYAEATGNYTLTVKSSGTAVKSTTAHDQLIGKAAPDFAGTFTLNGKDVKLSDLKGKVVLLDFCTVWTSPCIAAVPRLADWHKVYRAGGLEVVSVTYYGHEMGHKLGFDKKTGQFIKLEDANNDTEQTMLKDFAAHHKLAYRLTVLPKADALQTFNDYGVNGVPQLVLIDRAGVVRLIRVGDVEQNSGLLESEIKKLLAEK